MRHITSAFALVAASAAFAGNGTLTFNGSSFTPEASENFESFLSNPSTARNFFSEGDTIFGGAASLSWPIAGKKDPYTGLDYIPYEPGGVPSYSVSAFTQAASLPNGFANGAGGFWTPDGYVAGPANPNYAALGVDMNPVAQPLRISFAPTTTVFGFGGLFGVSGNPALTPSQTFTVTLYDTTGAIIGLDKDPITNNYLPVNGLNQFELTPGTWGYLGWYSSIRIGAIEFTGNAPVMDNLIITSVPEPGTIAAVGAGVALLLRRRRAKK